MGIDSSRALAPGYKGFVIRRSRARGFFWCLGVSALVVAALAGGWVRGEGPVTSEATAPPWKVSLAGYRELVLANSERLQASLLNLEVTNRLAQAERGLFEPALVVSGQHEENRRENTTQQRISLGNSLFDEDNNLYQSALEFLVPIGTRIRVGTSLRDLHNNLQRISVFTNGEYEAFGGVSLVQPLLRNAGRAATLAGLRVGRLNQEIAWQDYRRSLGQLLGAAEASYWALYLAQEQLGAFDESVKVAEGVLSDSRARLAAGKAAELDVLQAEADLANRRHGRNEALQRLREARMRTVAYLGTTTRDPRGDLSADPPPLPEGSDDLEFGKHWGFAHQQNPELLAARTRLEQEGVRLAYSRNQALPQLDLKASYGLNGLSDQPRAAADRAFTSDFPAWSVGLELRLPLGGDIRARNERGAAAARHRAAILGLQELENQVASGLQLALQRTRFHRGAIADTETAVRLNQNLLQTELARLEVGRAEARKVMEIERDLLVARITALASLVQYHQSRVELEVTCGVFLSRRQLERSRAEVARWRESLMSRPLPASASGRPLESTAPTRPAESSTIQTPEQPGPR